MAAGETRCQTRTADTFPPQALMPLADAVFLALLRACGLRRGPQSLHAASVADLEGLLARLGVLPSVVGAAASRRRSSAKVAREAVGVGINGFGRIGRLVARINLTGATSSKLDVNLLPQEAIKIRIGTINLASWWRHRDAALSAAAELGVDILACQESRINEYQMASQIAEFSKPGWHMPPGTASDCLGQASQGIPAGGGTVVLTSNMWRPAWRAGARFPGGEASVYTVHRNDAFFWLVNLRRRSTEDMGAADVFKTWLLEQAAAMPACDTVVFAGDWNVEADSPFSVEFDTTLNYRFLVLPEATRWTGPRIEAIDYFAIRADWAPLASSVFCASHHISDHKLALLDMPMLVDKSPSTGDRQPYHWAKLRRYLRPDTFKNDEVKMAAWLDTAELFWNDNMGNYDRHTGMEEYGDMDSWLQAWSEASEACLQRMLVLNPPTTMPKGDWKHKCRVQEKPELGGGPVSKTSCVEDRLRRFIQVARELGLKWQRGLATEAGMLASGLGLAGARKQKLDQAHQRPQHELDVSRRERISAWKRRMKIDPGGSAVYKWIRGAQWRPTDAAVRIKDQLFTGAGAAHAVREHYQQHYQAFGNGNKINDLMHAESVWREPTGVLDRSPLPGVNELRRALKPMRGKACGVDGWSADEAFLLPDSALESLINCFAKIEEGARPPTDWLKWRQVHFPKDSGRGTPEVARLRPISIACVWWMAWARFRAGQIAEFLKPMWPAGQAGGIRGVTIEHIIESLLSSIDETRSNWLWQQCGPDAEHLTVPGHAELHVASWDFESAFDRVDTMITTDIFEYLGGDPLSMLAMAVMLALPHHRAQRHAPSATNALYADVRTTITRDVRTMQVVQQVWQAFESLTAMCTNPKKTQTIDLFPGARKLPSEEMKALWIKMTLHGKPSTEDEAPAVRILQQRCRRTRSLPFPWWQKRKLMPCAYARLLWVAVRSPPGKIRIQKWQSYIDHAVLGGRWRSGCLHLRHFLVTGHSCCILYRTISRLWVIWRARYKRQGAVAIDCLAKVAEAPVPTAARRLTRHLGPAAMLNDLMNQLSPSFCEHNNQKGWHGWLGDDPISICPTFSTKVAQHLARLALRRSWWDAFKGMQRKDSLLAASARVSFALQALALLHDLIKHLPGFVQLACGVSRPAEGGLALRPAPLVPQPSEARLCLGLCSAHAEYLAYQMKCDSIRGRHDGTVEVDGGSLVIDGHKVALSHTRDPTEIPFKEHGADYARESTGAFLADEKIQPRLKAGAKKVAFSAPAKDDSHTIVMGVHQDTYKSDMGCVSGTSCTTNGLAPTVKAVNDAFGIRRGLMTPIHAMTAAQPTVDGAPKKDWYGGRAASGNIAVARVVPEVAGKLAGMAVRVPTIDVTVVNLTCELEKATTYEELCAEIKRRSEGDMKGFLGYCDEALVSTDFETCPISSAFDSKAGIMLDPAFVKLVAWYDNEWGYSCRVVDLIKPQWHRRLTTT
ncbi:unnamed protein product [Prorocentrum cordatum]|uniref:Glyceraldehyde 3-phosphate dehydrogenase NAD(P) binding domain-containing protein n=1 Tax=Prorocentrum cordatum TaxID=2364126 RepID=A0ABN9WKP9_9DINO|nr:unnamed protein product [Polarella glacialis]